MQERERLWAERHELREKRCVNLRVEKSLRHEANSLSVHCKGYGSHMDEAWLESRQTLAKVGKEREHRHGMVKKVDRSAVREVFEKYAMSETAYSGRKIRQGKLIGAFSELHRVIGHGRKGLTEVEWRKMLLGTVQQAMESGYRDLDGRYVAFDRDEEGMLDFNGFLYLCAVLRDRFDRHQTPDDLKRSGEGKDQREESDAAAPTTTAQKRAQYVVVGVSGKEKGTRSFEVPLAPRIGGGYEYREEHLARVPEMTVYSLKLRIEQMMGIPRELQKLFKGSIELLDAQSLADASIKTGSKIKLEIEDTDPLRRRPEKACMSPSRRKASVVKATRHHEYAAVAEEKV